MLAAHDPRLHATRPPCAFRAWRLRNARCAVSDPAAPDAAHYHAVRARTEALCRPLAIEDYGVQPMVDASPPKWHLAHTTWFFETFLLQPFAPGYRCYHSAFEHLFNSYYNGVGTPFPRPKRGALSRPTVEEVFAYRAHVDAAMRALLHREDAQVQSRIALGCQHEQQHQELIVTDVKANLGANPLKPAYRDAYAEDASLPVALAFHDVAGGIEEIGASGGFCFDNELPRHRLWLEDFAIANRLVTNAEYAEFIADGGYEKPALWLADGWAWRTRRAALAPMYWRREDGGWLEYRLDGESEPLDLAPVTHVSYFEADAFARWAGARLPTEAEWEVAAAAHPRAGVSARDALHPRAAVDNDLGQLFGDCWQWTSSAYGPYPGYRTLPGALGEYNGKFMSGQQVLRGGSCATPPGHARSSYRNFFYPKNRWQFTGIRLAKSVAA